MFHAESAAAPVVRWMQNPGAKEPIMTRLTALAIAPLLLSACVTTSTTTRTWGETYDEAPEAYARYGRVEQVRETVHRHRGDPAGGAVAGAVVGGIVGSSMDGGRGPGGLLGALFGAAVGANASQGAAEERIYEVFVRFEDGGWESFTYRGHLPFQPGDSVRWGPRGLERLR
jgi:outer membrane lipoprotein SlyB